MKVRSAAAGHRGLLWIWYCVPVSVEHRFSVPFRGVPGQPADLMERKSALGRGVSRTGALFCCMPGCGAVETDGSTAGRLTFLRCSFTMSGEVRTRWKRTAGENLAPLWRARREKRMDAERMAERLHVTDKAVSKWERRVSMPDTALLIPLAETLGVSVTELLRGERLESDAPLAQREVEMLVEGAVRLSAGEQQRRQEERQKWKRRWWLCLPLAVLGMAVLLLCAPDPAVFGGVLLVEGLCLGFGAVSVLRDPGCAAGLL